MVFAISFFSTNEHKKNEIVTTFHFLFVLHFQWLNSVTAAPKAKMKIDLSKYSSAWWYTWVPPKAHIDSYCQWCMWFTNKDRRQHLKSQLAPGCYAQCMRQIFKTPFFPICFVACIVVFYTEKKIGHLL